VRKAVSRLARTFEEFKVGRTFAATSTMSAEQHAQKAWEAYQSAASAAKGIVIGHGDAPIGQAYNGWQAFRTLNWSPEINRAWIEGAVDAGLPVKLVGAFQDVVRGSITWWEIEWTIARGGRLVAG
jgi:hypothetical protein